MRLARLGKVKLAVSTLAAAALVGAFAYGVSSLVTTSHPAFALSANSDFTITSQVFDAYTGGSCAGTPTATLDPGVTRCLAVSVHDPLSVDIDVHSLTMRVSSFGATPSAPSGTCSGTTLSLPTLFSSAFVVTAGTTAAIDKPIMLKSTGATQNHCENGTFHFSYAATATYTDTTTTTLTSTPNPSHADHPVTLTAVVAPSNPATDTLGPYSPSVAHTVSFYSCTTVSCSTRTLLSTTTLTETTGTAKTGIATYVTGSLHVGIRYFEAVYNGTPTSTPDFVGSQDTVTQRVSLVCSSTQVKGGLTVTTGETVCLRTTSVKGGVTVEPGGAIYFTGVTVAGGIKATGARTIRVCGSAVSSGGFSSVGATGFVDVGDASTDDTPSCAGNTLSGGVTIENGTGGFELGGDTITGSVSISGNVGVGPTPEGVNELEGNTITGKLSCATSNTPPLQNGGVPNAVKRNRSGQCAGTTF